ncbi:MAG: hypothetical protein U0359_05860 [Byssovorax sp.]
MLARVMPFAFVLGAALLAACSGGSADDPPAVCSTNKTWTQGDHGSPSMHPGGECITCHAQGEGPNFAIAGTVMGATNDDTNCDGVSGVTVEITDKNGQVIKLTSNSAGNFYSDEHGGTSVAFPITAKITANGKTAAMTTPQSTGDCNTCHAAVGKSGAPGRLTVPE